MAGKKKLGAKSARKKVATSKAEAVDQMDVSERVNRHVELMGETAVWLDVHRTSSQRTTLRKRRNWSRSRVRLNPRRGTAAGVAFVLRDAASTVVRPDC